MRAIRYFNLHLCLAGSLRALRPGDEPADALAGHS